MEARMSRESDGPQGEGDREADRRYREKTREFVKSGRVDEAAQEARKKSGRTDREAEDEGRARAHEEDPEVHRQYDKPTSGDD
jgi:hypothetical protein